MDLSRNAPTFKNPAVETWCALVASRPAGDLYYWLKRLDPRRISPETQIFVDIVQTRIAELDR